MAIPRRKRLEYEAGPQFRRCYVRAFAIASAIGLILGALWVIAGLLHFYVLP